MHEMVMLLLYGMLFAAVVLTFLRWGTLPADDAPEREVPARGAAQGSDAPTAGEIVVQATEEEHEPVYAKAN